MRVIYDNFKYPLWDDLGTIVVRYKSFFSKKSRRQRKLDNIVLLDGSLSNEWQSAAEISKNVGINFHQAVKLLQIAVERLDSIECKKVEWVDYKKRNRVTHLYRKKQVPVIFGLGIFSQVVPQVPVVIANARVFRCEDD